MQRTNSLTDGPIYSSLLQFAIPILLTIFLQALYGGVDLLVAGHFATTADVSGVASGSLILSTVTTVVSGFSMGVTILVGEHIGREDPKGAGRVIGCGICLFITAALLLMVPMFVGAPLMTSLLHAPKEAFAETVSYVRICSVGLVFVVAYNLLGAIFRGIGDAKTPFMTVSIACVINIVGDLLLVGGLRMGASGAALATVAAQAVSVLLSVLMMRKRQLPFEMTRGAVRFSGGIARAVFRLGTPVALQDLLVGISFLVVQMLVNSLGVAASAGIGIAEKVCVFIMLVPSAFSQSMSAFVAQNMGAGKPVRAERALFYGVMTGLAAGVLMCVLTFIRGDLLAAIFSKDAAVIAAAHSYLKAYAVDCLLTPFLFCFIGYFNGRERTLFVMLQGLVGAFLVRIPVAFFMSGLPEPTLFQIGLATPASSLVQVLLCLWMFKRIRGMKAEAEAEAAE